MDCRISGEREKSPEEMTEVEKLRAEVRLLRAEKRRAEIEYLSKKIRRDREEGRLSLIRQELSIGQSRKNTKNITIQSCYYVK